MLRASVAHCNNRFVHLPTIFVLWFSHTFFLASIYIILYFSLPSRIAAGTFLDQQPTTTILAAQYETLDLSLPSYGDATTSGKISTEAPPKFSPFGLGGSSKTEAPAPAFKMPSFDEMKTAPKLETPSIDIPSSDDASSSAPEIKVWANLARVQACSSRSCTQATAPQAALSS